MVNTREGQASSSILEIGRKAGVGLHITSLPGSHGIGDIGDSATSFIDKLVEMNIAVWQLLPTGPTAYGDSPYQPLSAFAGNSMLIGLDELVRLGLLTGPEVDSLNDFPGKFTDYGKLIPAKSMLLSKSAERFTARQGGDLGTAYDEFLQNHGELWLNEYAIFRVLKAMHGERAWPEWEKSYVHREPAAIRKFVNKHRVEIEHIKIIQFLFEYQWQNLRRYAADSSICLFGDMPIYIALDSSDAWAHPEMLLIDQDGQPENIAGVPPDYFSNDGQLWGNPLYDWDFHERTGYQWWIDRMKRAASQTDLVRIDHFRGFESFWSVPFGSHTARDGVWKPGPGDELFGAMHQALGNLPIVAEDLGVITKKVKALRRRHGIPGMVVLQFGLGEPEFDPDDIEENCVCYTGTHDNDTTLGWFRGEGDDTRTKKEIIRTQANALRLTGGSPVTISSDMIRLAFSSQASIAVAPMQDYLGLGSEARFNIPGTTLNNWRWRLCQDQLHPGFVDSVHEMVIEASRV